MIMLGLMFVLAAGGGATLPFSAPVLLHPWGALPEAEVSFLSEIPAESEIEKAEWLPDRTLGYEQDGSRYASSYGYESFASYRLALPGEAERPPRDLLEPNPIWVNAVPAIESLVMRGFMEPLDYLCRVQNVRATYEKGISDLSIGTSLPAIIDSLGFSLGDHSFLSLNFDMLGFEDSDSRIILDDRHATARLSYISTSLGIRLKF